MTTPITEFLDKHNILWEPIAINNKVPTKIGDYKPDPNDYKLPRELLISRQTTPSEYIAIFTNEIAQYDVDVEGFKVNEIFKDLPYYESITKKLPHIFVKVTGVDNARYTVLGGDLLCGQWAYCKRNAVVYNSKNDIKEVKYEKFENRVNFNRFKAILKRLKESVDSYDYDTWLNICFALFNTAVENGYKDPMSYATEFSKDGIKYDDKAKNTINSLVYDPNGLKFGTLIMYAEGIETKNKSKKIVEEVVNDDEYEEWKKQWEKNVFSCKARNLVCHDKYKDSHITEASYGSNYFINDNDFVKLSTAVYFEKSKPVSCVKRWNLDPCKREYMDYIFAPYPFKPNNNYTYYNTWNDFKYVNYLPEENLDAEHCIQVYKDFKMHLAKNNDIVYDFLIQMDAHTAQFPGEKIGVCTIICGESGTGKGTEYLLQSSIFGTEYVYQTNDINTVLGQFTGSISKKLIVVLDEAVPKSMFDKDGPLKSLITETTVKIERKGKDAYVENSFVRLIITSNSDYVVNISNSDRRMFVINPDIYIAKKYEKFPHDIFELINSKDACKCVFDYLRTVNVKYRNIQQWQYYIPKTEAYIDMQNNSIPGHVQFLIYFVNTHEADKLEFTINQSDLYEYYVAYISDNRRTELSKHKFYTAVKKITSIGYSKVRSGKSTVVSYRINKLEFNGEMAKKNYRLDY